MKTKTKWLIGAAVLTLAVGGYAMKELVFGFGDEVFEKKPTKEEKQLAYLKEHEQEIVDFVKAQNPKIESVQIDWGGIKWAESSFPFDDTRFILIYGEFNNNKNSSWGLSIEYDKNQVYMETMTFTNDLRIGGEYFE